MSTSEVTQLPSAAELWPFRTVEEQDRYKQRNTRIMIASAATGAIIGGVFGFLGGDVQETTDNAEDLRVADGYMRCASYIVKRTARPNEELTVTYSRLSDSRIDDCGITPPSFMEEDTEAIDADANATFAWQEKMSTLFFAKDAWVTLRPAEDYEQAANDREERADYNHFDVGAQTVLGAMGGASVGFIASLGVVVPMRRRAEREAVNQGRFKPVEAHQ